MTKARYPVILLGAGGHAKVLLSLLHALNWQVNGVCAPELTQGAVEYWRGIQVVSEDFLLNHIEMNAVVLVNCVGKIPGINAREQVFERFRKKGFTFQTLVHPDARVDATAILGEGVQVMAGAIIQADVKIDDNTIINTSASIDHDCFIGAHVHIAPGSVLCGNVMIEKRCFVGSGAVITPGVHIGEEACIGAGASIVRDILPKQKVIPASS